MKISEVKTADLAKTYIQLRDRRDTRKKLFTEEDSTDKRLQERIECELLRRFDADGLESVRTQFGTAYAAIRVSATVADRGIFLDYLKTNDAWDLADIRVMKTNVKEFKEEHDDLPPGINWSESREIGVLRGKG